MKVEIGRVDRNDYHENELVVSVDDRNGNGSLDAGEQIVVEQNNAVAAGYLQEIALVHCGMESVSGSHGTRVGRSVTASGLRTYIHDYQTVDARLARLREIPAARLEGTLHDLNNDIQHLEQDNQGAGINPNLETRVFYRQAADVMLSRASEEFRPGNRHAHTVFGNRLIQRAIGLARTHGFEQTPEFQESLRGARAGTLEPVRPTLDI